MTQNYLKKKLEKREKTGSKIPINYSHGDYIKKSIHERKSKPEWINTKKNIADIMTKPLPLESHKPLRITMMNLDQNKSNNEFK